MEKQPQQHSKPATNHQVSPVRLEPTSKPADSLDLTDFQPQQDQMKVSGSPEVLQTNSPGNVQLSLGTEIMGTSKLTPPPPTSSSVAPQNDMIRMMQQQGSANMAMTSQSSGMWNNSSISPNSNGESTGTPMSAYGMSSSASGTSTSPYLAAAVNQFSSAHQYMQQGQMNNVGGYPHSYAHQAYFNALDQAASYNIQPTTGYQGVDEMMSQGYFRHHHHQQMAAQSQLATATQQQGAFPCSQPSYPYQQGAQLSGGQANGYSNSSECHVLS